MEEKTPKLSGMITAALMCFFIFSVPSSAQQISLKISGSINYFNPEHINRNLHGREELLKKFALSTEGWNYKEGEVKDLHFGTSFEGEFLLSLTSRLSLGVGAGYIYAEATEEKTGITLERPSDTLLSVHPTKINVFPVFVSGYYFLPLSQGMKLYLRGGSGLLWAEYIERAGNWVIPGNRFIQLIYQKATALAPFLFSSFGLSYEAHPDIRFFIEAEAKLARTGEFQGDLEEGDTGTLFSYEEFNQNLGFWQAKNGLHQEKPSAEDFRRVEETVVGLSGFSLKIGIVIKF